MFFNGVAIFHNASVLLILRSVPAVFTVFLLIYETTFFTASLALHHRRVIGQYEVNQSSPMVGDTGSPVGHGGTGVESPGILEEASIGS